MPWQLVDPRAWLAMLPYYSPMLVPIGIIVRNHYRLRRAGFRPAITPSSRRIDHAFDPRVRSFTGGGRTGYRSGSWPLARLQMDGEWARVSVSRGMGLGGLLQGPTPRVVWNHRSEVTCVTHVRVGIHHSVLFQAYDGRFDGVVFFTFGTLVMEHAAWFGWPTCEA